MAYANAQVDQTKTRILFLIDCSGSMSSKMDNTTRMAIAKKVMTRIVDSLAGVPGITMAIRAYGWRSPKSKHDCRDTRLEVPFGRENKEQIKKIDTKILLIS